MTGYTQNGASLERAAGALRKHLFSDEAGPCDSEEHVHQMSGLLGLVTLQRLQRSSECQRNAEHSPAVTLDTHIIYRK